MIDQLFCYSFSRYPFYFRTWGRLTWLPVIFELTLNILLPALSVLFVLGGGAIFLFSLEGTTRCTDQWTVLSNVRFNNSSVAMKTIVTHFVVIPYPDVTVFLRLHFYGTVDHSPVSIAAPCFWFLTLFVWLTNLQISRNKRKRQPIGILGRSSDNHDWLLSNASACVSCGFRLRNARNASDCVWMETGPYVGLPDMNCSRRLRPRNVMFSVLNFLTYSRLFPFRDLSMEMRWVVQGPWMQSTSFASAEMIRCSYINTN